MGVGEVTGFTGWVAFVLIGLEVLTPYLLRRSRLNEILGTVKRSQAKQPETPRRGVSKPVPPGYRLRPWDWLNAGAGVLRLYPQDTKLAGRKVNRMRLKSVESYI
jgi:hypothetical protein